jgi:hypothetical protein
MKVLFLFGAGASKGAESEKANQPPLGSELFRDLASDYPESWGKLHSQPFDDDFESAMKKLMLMDPDKVVSLKKEMAEYFFKFDSSSKNLYGELAKKFVQFIGIDTVAFVTLNYECLLERALVKSDFKPIYFGQKSNNSLGEVELCFPHGCCHFWLDGFSGPPESFSFSMGDGLFDGPVIVCKDHEEFYRQLKTNPLPPIMSFIEPNKTNPTGKKNY